jgi:L-2-hydroxyglutarate oxidase LhgO
LKVAQETETTMPDHRVDLLIAGGGIVGLATALRAVGRFPDLRLIVVEKEARLAAHQTEHNSGVIHSGLYYRPGSLTARNCVAGAASLKRFCGEHGVPFEECGKLVVATKDDEVARLEALHQRGIANGVPGLRMLPGDAIRDFEPHCVGMRALHVASTGIVDYTVVAQKYAELIQQAGGEIRCGAKVTGFTREADTNIVETTAGSIRAKFVINCAGLYSDQIAKLAGAGIALEIIPFRGEYYEVRPEKRYLVKNLIYPVPDPRFPFLGVHFTRRVNGSVEAGPNAVLALRREGYSGTEPDLAETLELLQFPGFWKMAQKYWRMGAAEQYRSWVKSAFTTALQRMLPGLQESDLEPGGSGVRAQAVDRNGNLLDDFCFVHAPGMIHVCTVPSPAATASLEIGREIVDMLTDRFELAAPDRAAQDRQAASD